MGIVLTLPVKADTDPTPPPPPPPPTPDIVLLPSRPKDRPNSSDENYYISLTWSADGIEFNLPEGIDSVNVIVYNNTQGWLGFVSRELNIITIPLPEGEYTIECYSDDGTCFSGTIKL